MAKAGLILITSFAVFVTCTSLAQTVYSWQDEKGVTHFSQQPPTQGNYKLISVRTNSAATSVTTAESSDGNSDGLDPALCAQAKEQLSLIESGQELFTRDRSGTELRLLTSEEREQQRLLANFEIKRRCPAAP